MTLFEQRDRIIKEYFKPVFKANGFRASGINFTKSEKGFVKVFNIQSSGFNFDHSVSFYLNIGFFFPIRYEVQDYPFPKSVKEYNCQFSIRSSELTGEYPVYQLTSKTNIEDFERLVAVHTEKYILPFFSKFKDIRDCINVNSYLSNKCHDLGDVVGLTLIKAGEVDEGDKIFNEYLSRLQNQNWKSQLAEYRKTI